MSDAYKKEKWILGGASGRMITTPSGYFGDGFIADVDTKANADFIVTACNSHDALLSACHTILSNFKANINFGTLPSKIEIEAGINVLQAAIDKAQKI